MDIIFILLWFTVCSTTHLLFKFKSKDLIHNFDTLNNANKIIWYNKGTASFHAFTLFILTAIYWLNYQDIDSLNSFSRSYEIFCVNIMLGYLIYDTIFELFLSTSLSITTLLHHFLGIVSLSCSIYYSCDICFRLHMIIFVAESSTPFLHISWLMHQLKTSETIIFKCTFLTLIIFFFFSRIILGPYLLIITAYSKEFKHTYPLLYYLNIFIVASFVFLNFYWFYLLIRLSLTPKSKIKNV